MEDFFTGVVVRHLRVVVLAHACLFTFVADISLQHCYRKPTTFILFQRILFDSSISLACVFILEEPFIVIERFVNTMDWHLNARRIVALILSPLLSKMLNVWATSLFTEVLVFDTQMYLRELLGLEKLLHYWIWASLLLSFILFDRA